MLTIYTEKETIQIAFPKSKYAGYLKTEGIVHESNMTLQQIKCIFIRTISDFENGTNSTDDIAVVSSRLLNLLNGKPTQNPEFAQLKDMLDSAAELGFYIRFSDHAIFNAILRDVRSYAKT